MMQKQMRGLQAAPVVQPQPDNSVNDQIIKELITRIENLENELDLFKQDFSRWIKEMQDSLNQKADIETVKALENSLLERLNEIVKALSK